MPVQRMQLHFGVHYTIKVHTRCTRNSIKEQENQKLHNKLATETNRQWKDQRKETMAQLIVRRDEVHCFHCCPWCGCTLHADFNSRSRASSTAKRRRSNQNKVKFVYTTDLWCAHYYNIIPWFVVRASVRASLRVCVCMCRCRSRVPAMELLGIWSFIFVLFRAAFAVVVVYPLFILWRDMTVTQYTVHHTECNCHRHRRRRRHCRSCTLCFFYDCSDCALIKLYLDRNPNTRF